MQSVKPGRDAYCGIASHAKGEDRAAGITILDSGEGVPSERSCGLAKI